MDPQQFDRVIQIARITFCQGIGPRIVGVHNASQQALIDRIDVRPWPLYTETSIPYLNAMRALRSFHKVTRGLCSRPEQRPWPLHWIQDLTPLNADLIPTQMSEAIQKCSEISRVLNPLLEQRPRMCHGDFTKGNVLLTKDWKPMLVDFDSAGAGDPFFDVVKFSIALPARTREELFKAYLGDRDPSLQEKARYELMDLSLLMVVAKVRFGSAQKMLATGSSSLSRQEMESMCSSVDPLPSFLSIPFSDQTVQARQTGAVYALHEFLRRTRTSHFRDLLITVRSAN
jgi:hypothetical protein